MFGDPAAVAAGYGIGGNGAGFGLASGGLPPEGDALRATFAVNPDPRESDLAPASETAVLAAFPPGRATIVRPGSDLARRVREARYGRELWPWFVMLALALLVAETVIGRWWRDGLPRTVCE